MPKIFYTKNAKKKNCTKKLTASSSGCCFFVQKSAKKYGKNKNSVYWIKKEGVRWNAGRKKKKSKKAKTKKERRLETVRLLPAPKAPCDGRLSQAKG